LQEEEEEEEETKNNNKKGKKGRKRKKKRTMQERVMILDRGRTFPGYKCTFLKVRRKECSVVLCKMIMSKQAYKLQYVTKNSR
jgi:chromatin remodeling complex protein RSC6